MSQQPTQLLEPASNPGMPNFPFTKPTGQSLAMGILAGLIGGLAGSGIKILGEKIYPPRTHGQESPPAVLAEKIAGHPLTKTQKEAATQYIHWTTGAIIGAIYGATAEFAPIATIGYGSALGLIVLLTTHESALPLLGLNEPPLQQPKNEQLSELLTHTLYGVSTEAVRRALRAWLNARSH